jgi:hypothetical protein
MKAFAIGCVVAVVLLTVVGAFSVQAGARAAAIGGAGFGCLLLALCFYALADIRATLHASLTKHDG